MIWKATLGLLLLIVITVQGDATACEGDDCAGERNVGTESLSGGKTKLCLPDLDGKVGKTDGESSVTLYAFGMETLRNSSIDDVLYSFKTTIQMHLIEKYLPEECININRNLQEEEVEGFRFDEDLDGISGTYQP